MVNEDDAELEEKVMQDGYDPSHTEVSKVLTMKVKPTNRPHLQAPSLPTQDRPDSTS